MYKDILSNNFPCRENYYSVYHNKLFFSRKFGRLSEIKKGEIMCL